MKTQNEINKQAVENAKNKLNAAVEQLKTATTFINENNYFAVEKKVQIVSALNRLFKSELVMTEKSIKKENYSTTQLNKFYELQEIINLITQ